MVQVVAFGGSGLVQVGFMFGSGVGHFWFRLGSDWVQVGFRLGKLDSDWVHIEFRFGSDWVQVTWTKHIHMEYRISHFGASCSSPALSAWVVRALSANVPSRRAWAASLVGDWPAPPAVS